MSSEVVVILAVLTAAFIGPSVVLPVLIWRKRRARARRLSPLMRVDLLRSPGQSLRSQIDEVQDDAGAVAALLIASPLILLSLFLGQAHVKGLDTLLRLAPIYGVAGTAAIAFMAVWLWRIAQKLDGLRLGYDAELAVGQQLDQLMRKGAAVFHDFPAQGFNIDHVVVAPQGVFAVETKGRSKPGELDGTARSTVIFDGQTLVFPTGKTSEPLEQAQRQAKWLAQWLTSATGDTISVLPVVALPGWYVDTKGRGDVRVYNAKLLAGLLDARGAVPLTSEVFQRVAHQVERQCRDVRPLTKH